MHEMRQLINLMEGSENTEELFTLRDNLIYVRKQLMAGNEHLTDVVDPLTEAIKNLDYAAHEAADNDRGNDYE